MVSEKELIEIFRRIEKNVATEEDILTYNTWCNSFQNASQFQSTDDFEKNKIALFKKIEQRINKKGKQVRLLMSAAAILFLVLLSPVLYQLFKGQKEASAITSAPSIDIKPGINMATLTLSDGRKIELSAEKNQLIAVQNGVEISRPSDSVITFKETELNAPLAQRAASINSLSTGHAQKFQLVLPDGTKVWLNAATTIKFPTAFSGQQQRKVELEGEAYFEVTRKTDQPFVVITKQQEIKVLGTHFNVKTHGGKKGTTTTLLEGSVKVNDKLTLKPGEQAESGSEGGIRVRKVNAKAEVAWQSGYFNFDDKNIYDVMEELSKWYNVKAVYHGEISTDKMKGTISRFQNVSAVLAVLEATGVFKFKIEKDLINVHGATPQVTD